MNLAQIPWENVIVIVAFLSAFFGTLSKFKKAPDQEPIFPLSPYGNLLAVIILVGLIAGLSKEAAAREAKRTGAAKEKEMAKKVIETHANTARLKEDNSELTENLKTMSGQLGDAINLDKGWKQEVLGRLMKLSGGGTVEPPSTTRTTVEIETETGEITRRARALHDALPDDQFVAIYGSRRSNSMPNRATITFYNDDQDRSRVTELEKALERIGIQNVKLVDSGGIKNRIHCYLPSRGWIYAGKYDSNTGLWSDGRLKNAHWPIEVGAQLELSTGVTLHRQNQDRQTDRKRLPANSRIEVLDVDYSEQTYVWLEIL